MMLLAPAVPFCDLSFGGLRLPGELMSQRYGALTHGTDLCDELPAVYTPVSYIEGTTDYVRESDMTYCVEPYAGAVDFSVDVDMRQQAVVAGECPSADTCDKRRLS